jgi:hypothetical protein
MKILRVSLAALGCFAAVSTAQAKELTFFFDVFSSGPEIYPCDAGIWQGQQPKYCHYKGTATNCNPNELGKTPGQTGVTTGMTTVDGSALSSYFSEAHACICTGGTGNPNTGVRGGDYLMNFMRYKAAVWEGQDGSTDPNHRGWGTAVERTAQGTLDGVTVARHVRETQGMTMAPATNVEQEFKTQLESVTFNFGSELYGAHFFVDFCYRGPQIPYWLGNGNPMNAKAQFASFAWLKSTNPFTGGDATTGKPTLNYTSLSNLKMKTVMVCDKQGQGTYKYDHNGATPNGGAFDSFLTDIRDQGNIDVSTLAGNGVQVAGINGTGVNPNQQRFVLPAPTGGTNWVGTLEGDKKFGPLSLTDLSVRPDQYWLFGGANGNVVTITEGSSAETPRFCKLRTYFVEESGKRERAWQRHDARFIVKWLVEENVTDDSAL